MTFVHRACTFFGLLCAGALVSGCALEVDDETGEDSVGEEPIETRDDALSSIFHNSGFESKLGGCGPGMIDKWTNCTWNDGVAKRSTHSDAPDSMNGGSWGLHVVGDAQVWQETHKNSIDGGKTYKLRALTKCKWGVQQLRFYFTNKKGYLVKVKSKYISSETWKAHTITMKAPASAVAANVVIDGLVVTGDCSWDNVRLTEQ